jgi:Xaa-Pro aminopeptidase
MEIQRRSLLRQRLLNQEAKTVAVFESAPVAIRNNDVEHDYRQDSDLFYLTGIDEPNCVLVLSTSTDVATLFLRTRDPEREVWDGPRLGVEGAKALGFDAYPISELTERLPKLLSGHRAVCTKLGLDRRADERIFEGVRRARMLGRTGAEFPLAYIDPAAALHEMRLIKSAAEIDCMQKAADISREAHVAAMRQTRPGMFEHEIEAILMSEFRKRGSERAAYGSIVGSGPNATTLHYRSNNRKMNAGELLLIDAGCEFKGYASDVTRTFPVSGSFSPAQERIYQLVLDAQLAAIESVRPGATLEGIHACAALVLTRGLLALGILQGELEPLIAEAKYKPFYMHRTSHWLGMDVHDVGFYFSEGKPRPLEPGMVLTIEPGLYFGEGVKALCPAEYQGIGVRIEDDIVVTESGYTNLSAAIPKSVAELRRVQAAS